MNDGNTGSIGFVGLLQIAFIILKLCKIINWKWIWVLAPTWISISTILILFLTLGVIYLIQK